MIITIKNSSLAHYLYIRYIRFKQTQNPANMKTEIPTTASIRKMHKALRKEEINIQQWWDYISIVKLTHKDLLEEVIKNTINAQDRLRKYCNSPLFRNKIRKFINRYDYSDVHPFEVIKIINEKKIIARQMKAELKTAPIQHPGGFLAYTENHTQEWTITSDEEAPAFILKLNKDGWGLGKFHMSTKPIHFYDYNF